MTRQLLIVDDNRDVLEWLLEELGGRGFDVEGTTEPARALARIEERGFDLVVSDVEMPGMRGLDLVQAIHARRTDQLVVLITAFGSIELAMSCVRAGASDFLAKPFSIEALVHMIERTIRERRMRREIVRVRGALRRPPPPSC